jgi:hypothetical protein
MIEGCCSLERTRRVEQGDKIWTNFSLLTFIYIKQVFYYKSSPKYIHIAKKYSLGDFFTNSSGHPGVE